MSRNRYATARRSIWYILKILLVLVAAIALALGVFVAGLYTSNIYIILQDGMELRAECILQGGAQSDLTEYFTEDFIAQDTALSAGAYDQFTVSAFDYRLEVEKLFALPWEDTVDVRVVQKLASIAAAPNDQSENTLPPALPEWPTTRCSVTFVRRDGRWYIDKITVLETDPAQKPLPTPDMSSIGQG